MVEFTFKKILKKGVLRVQRERCHATHARMARILLGNIEQQNGEALSKKVKRQSCEYARDALGSEKYAPWLDVYAALHGTFVEGWIPGDYYQLVVLPLKNGQIGQATNTKTLTNRLLNTPTLPDIAYLIDGNCYGIDYSILEWHELLELLFASEERVFFKPDRSFQGKGIRILEKAAVTIERLQVLPDGVFQRPIIQHEAFDAFTPNSTATLRLTTAKSPSGSVELRAADLRLGRATDHFVRAVSEIRVPIDVPTGVLLTHGYMPDWGRVISHPDTGYSFIGFSIPGYCEARKVCCSLHQGFPHLGCIGWDIAIDCNEGARIMEWNARHNSIVFSEATTGPSFIGLGWDLLWQR